MKITRDNVTIELHAEAEFTRIEHVAKGCADGFKEAVLAQQKKNRRWGWCCVHVVAILKTGSLHLEGHAYLGCCSYGSKGDFIKNSGYYDQLVNDAIDDLKRAYKEHVKIVVQQVLDVVNDNYEDVKLIKVSGVPLGVLLNQTVDILKPLNVEV